MTRLTDIHARLERTRSVLGPELMGLSLTDDEVRFLLAVAEAAQAMKEAENLARYMIAARALRDALAALEGEQP